MAIDSAEMPFSWHSPRKAVLHPILPLGLIGANPFFVTI